MLRGRCACNAVAFEVSDEFVVAYNCHCSNCRAATGSAFLPWGEIEPEKLRVTKGADSLMLIGDAHSHHARRCGKCFSLLYWTGYEGKIRGGNVLVSVHSESSDQTKRAKEIFERNGAEDISTAGEAGVSDKGAKAPREREAGTGSM